MRILLVNKFHYRRGGSEAYYFALAEGLRSKGHEVACFSMQDDRNLPCEQARYFVSPREYDKPASLTQRLGSATSLIYSREAKRKFDALCREFRPDVIHLNLVHRQISFSILDAPAAQGIPVVYTAHDYVLVCPAYTMLDGGGAVCDDCLDGHFMHCARKRCVKSSLAKSALAVAEAEFLRRHGSYGKVGLFIAPSVFMRDKLVEGGIPAHKVVAMQNFAPDDLMERAGGAGDATDRTHPYLLFFGRLSHEKGVELLVRAFLAVLPSLPGDWSLVIAGDGPRRDALLELLGEAQGADHVRLVGSKSGDELRRLVRQASFAVVPSVWRENMPYSIIEAFAQGTPVIGTRIGGIPELVMGGRTGCPCEAGDVGSLAQAIERATSMDVTDYRHMQAACREYVLTRCDQATYISDLVGRYGRLRAGG